MSSPALDNHRDRRAAVSSLGSSTSSTSTSSTMGFAAGSRPSPVRRVCDKACRVMASRLRAAGRRVAPHLPSPRTDHRFVYAFTACAVFAAKAIHLHLHHTALATFTLQRWGYCFLAQDFALLILIRLILEIERGLNPASTARFRALHHLVSVVAGSLVAFVNVISVVTISFFFVARAAIHWRNVAVAGDAAGRAILLSGLVTLALVLGALSLCAWILQDALYALGGVAADVVSWPLVFLSRGRLRRVRLLPQQSSYVELPQRENDADKEDSRPSSPVFSFRRRRLATLLWLLVYGIVTGGLLAQAIMTYRRPNEGALNFMSLTPPLLPFTEFESSSYTAGRRDDWNDRNTITSPLPISWLPPGTPLAGFEDWYGDKGHYNASADPLVIRNMHNGLLPELRDKLQSVPIRHIMVIVLESTRKDVFPIKENGINLRRFRETWPDEKLPDEAMEHLKNLTPTAKYLTGDFDDGFDTKPAHAKPRGGMSFNDAYTSSTYTLKSLTGTLCGVNPLVADFNVEYQHHIYNPCLPHLLEAFNSLDQTGAANFTGYKWKSSFMQTATLDFDHFDKLMVKLGFPSDSFIDRDSLRKEDTKFGRVKIPDVYYFGFQEYPLQDYIRDAFRTANESNERVFLTHVTSTSHHPWALPDGEEQVQLANGLEDLVHYINTIGYDDRWLARILQILDEEGVADETLVVFQGDHGVSMPENRKVASYYNPIVGNNHVPLVLSHPKMPPITINDAVSAQQVLPTILDLLMETGSLSEPARRAARDMMRLYEGQSLARPLRNTPTTPAAFGNWHFTVINPGRAMVGVRDANQKTWRLVVPTIKNVEWYFSNLERDPEEANFTKAFDLPEFLQKVKEDESPEAAKWAEEAIFATRWWVEDNAKRWHYGAFA